MDFFDREWNYMDNINRNSVLERAFHRFSKVQVIEYIKGYRVGFVLDKDKKNKGDLKDDFLLLKNVLSEQDIINLAEMAVMKRKKGLSAYTYNFKNLGKLKDKTIEEIKTEFVKSYVLNSMFEVVLVDTKLEDEKLTLSIKVKEYGTYWKMGVQDLNSLTAVYDNKVTFEKDTKKVSIEAGDDNIEDVIEKFLSIRLGIPLVPYTIRIFNSSYTEQDSASEKTMLIFDFIYNRLPAKGISSSFNDVKFKMKNSTRNGGVKGITVHGNDIIASDEACKYITLSNDIVSFKTTSLYQGSKVNIQFSLKGKDFDKMKIVILDNKSELYKQEVMNLLQKEYILMCSEGIKNIVETRRMLEPIYQSYIASRT
jgi:hypothetical protein